MTHDEIIAVIAAHRAGKPLQVRRNQQWQQESIQTAELLHNIAFGMNIRPKPEPRRVFIPCDTNGPADYCYTTAERAMHDYPDMEIVTFVEEASE